MNNVASPERSIDYERIASAISYIQQHRLEQPSLEQLAEHVGLSPYHFQRLFVRWAGVSPKRFLSYLTVEHAKSLLREGASVLDASLSVGLSGSSRLHDQFISLEAMTPGEYKRSGADLVIRYSFHLSRFGKVMVLQTERGICGVRFVDEGSQAERDVLAEVKEEWPLSQFEHHPDDTCSALSLFSDQEGTPDSIRLLVRGTQFQTKVWQALLAIPEGVLESYQDVARSIGQEKASRAVGSAIGANPIAFLIPCHRVLRASGEISGYRWGTARKMALLGWESARLSIRSDAG